MFLVNAKDDGLVESAVCFQEIGEVAGDSFGAGRRETFRSKSLVVYSASGISTPQTVKLRPCSDASPLNQRL